MEQDCVAFADLNTLLFGRGHDVFFGIGRAFLENRLTVKLGHVEHNAACDDRRELFQTEFFQSVGLGKVIVFKAVVIGVAYTDVAEPVNLWAYAEPAHKDVVVVGHMIMTKTFTLDLVRLQHGQAH